MAIEDDILALLQTVDAKIDIIQTEIVAIKTETDKLEFYPYYTVSGTLTPDVIGDYFFYKINEYGNVYKNYLGDLIEAAETGFILRRGIAASWTGADLVGDYIVSTGATGTATTTQKYCSVVHPDLITLSETRSNRNQPVVIDMRNI